MKRSPLLLTVFAITFFYGMASEGFDRLWVAHFIDNLGFPAVGDLNPVIWFGVVRMGSMVLSIVAVGFLRRRVDTNSRRVVARGLFLINALQAGALILFAAGGDFLIGLIAYWTIVSVSWAYDPLQLAWLNQNTYSSVRATVISMNSQTNSFGQIAGGPMLGALGNFVSLRASLYAAGAVLLPALLLYTRAFHQGAPPAPRPTDAGDADDA